MVPGLAWNAACDDVAVRVNQEKVVCRRIAGEVVRHRCYEVTESQRRLRVEYVPLHPSLVDERKKHTALAVSLPDLRFQVQVKRREVRQLCRSGRVGLAACDGCRHESTVFRAKLQHVDPYEGVERRE